MSFLDSFTFINYSKHKILKNKAFERGFKLGEELAIELLRDKQRYNCRKLNDFEKAMVIKFLEDYNFEFGYDPYNRGFYITKRRTDESR